MKLIKFPLAAQTRSSRQNLRLSIPDVVHNQIKMGPWDFTCTRCDTKIRFESSGMIFRTVDFYCNSCGALHRVTNPAFASSPAPKSK